jgi:hypothetical protein
VTERFTAVLKIVKVEETTPTTRDRGVVDATSKKDTELLSITIRSKTLEGLLSKSKAHLDLVEDHTA